MYCKRCGKQLNDEAVFCKYCGQKVTVPGAVPTGQNAPQQSVTKTQEKMQHPASRNMTESEAPAGKSGVAKGVVVGAVAAIAVIVFGVGLYVSSSRHNNDEDEQPSTRYEETRESSDSDSQENISEPEPSGSDSSEEQETPQSSSEVEQQPASQYILPTSNTQYLTVADLMGLTKDECRIARNELYARYGRRFNDAELQAHFDACDWYKGTTAPEDFDDSVLNEYEIANRDLIVQYEEEYFISATYSAYVPQIAVFEMSNNVLTASTNDGSRYGWVSKEPFSVSYPVAEDCIWEQGYYLDDFVHEGDTDYESVRGTIISDQEYYESLIRENGEEWFHENRPIESPIGIHIVVSDGVVVRVYTTHS